MPGPNLLIGNGQVLAGAIPREPGGGGNKQYPYTIQEARDRLGPALTEILVAVDALPASAKPRGEVTSVVTVHPAFQAKTQMPAEAFQRAGLRAVGSTGESMRHAITKQFLCCR